MKVNELIPILNILRNIDRDQYTVECSFKIGLLDSSYIASRIYNYEYSAEDKVITFTNRPIKPGNDLLFLKDICELLSSGMIDDEADVVFGHYIKTGKDSETLITADGYTLLLDNVYPDSENIKFDIIYEFLNI